MNNSASSVVSVEMDLDHRLLHQDTDVLTALMFGMESPSTFSLNSFLQRYFIW